MHKFELKQKHETDEEGTQYAMHGANAVLLMDGKVFDGVRKVTVEVEAGRLAVMTIEVLGQFSVTGNFEPVVTKKNSTSVEPKPAE